MNTEYTPRTQSTDFNIINLCVPCAFLPAKTTVKACTVLFEVNSFLKLFYPFLLQPG